METETNNDKEVEIDNYLESADKYFERLDAIKAWHKQKAISSAAWEKGKKKKSLLSFLLGIKKLS